MSRACHTRSPGIRGRRLSSRPTGCVPPRPPLRSLLDIRIPAKREPFLPKRSHLPGTPSCSLIQPPSKITCFDLILLTPIPCGASQGAAAFKLPAGKASARAAGRKLRHLGRCRSLRCQPLVPAPSGLWTRGRPLVPRSAGAIRRQTGSRRGVGSWQPMIAMKEHFPPKNVMVTPGNGKV
jgi:hypothetical protein